MSPSGGWATPLSRMWLYSLFSRGGSSGSCHIDSNWSAARTERLFKSRHESGGHRDGSTERTAVHASTGLPARTPAGFIAPVLRACGAGGRRQVGTSGGDRERSRRSRRLGSAHRRQAATAAGSAPWSPRTSGISILASRRVADARCPCWEAGYRRNFDAAQKSVIDGDFVATGSDCRGRCRMPGRLSIASWGSARLAQGLIRGAVIYSRGFPDRDAPVYAPPRIVKGVMTKGVRSVTAGCRVFAAAVHGAFVRSGARRQSTPPVRVLAAAHAKHPRTCIAIRCRRGLETRDDDDFCGQAPANFALPCADGPWRRKTRAFAGTPPSRVGRILEVGRLGF
jgi:hypothetical protein